jgi:ABC-type sugar transport system ATPase subunit
MAQKNQTPKNVPMVCVKGIYKSFGMNTVLKGIDLSVNPGEVVALIGGNGENHYGYLPTG